MSLHSFVNLDDKFLIQKHDVFITYDVQIGLPSTLLLFFSYFYFFKFANKMKENNSSYKLQLFTYFVCFQFLY